MTRSERVFVFAGLTLSLVLGLSAHLAETPAVATQATAAAPKLATIDAYVITERLMGVDELKRIRDAKSLEWESKARTLERELQDLDQSLQIMPQSDPKFTDTQRRLAAKQSEYQALQGQRQQELEDLNSKQLIEAFNRVVATARTIADRGGYTHLFMTREYDRAIDTNTVGATLQELLARPVIKGPPADDLTKTVMAELKLDATAPAAPAAGTK